MFGCLTLTTGGNNSPLMVTSNGLQLIPMPIQLIILGPQSVSHQIIFHGRLLQIMFKPSNSPIINKFLHRFFVFPLLEVSRNKVFTLHLHRLSHESEHLLPSFDLYLILHCALLVLHKELLFFLAAREVES